MIIGRRALKEIRWSGERGRKTARRAIAVNAVVTALVVVEGVTGWVPGRGGTTDTSVLGLKTGQCYVNTEKRALDQDAIGYVTMKLVHVVDCGTEHDGEVAGLWDAGTAWRLYPSDDEMRSRAGSECARVILGYAPDTWRLPQAAEVHDYMPSQAGWNSGGHHHVVCVIGSADGKFTGSLRQDPAALTADQAAYLDAEDDELVVSMADPDEARITADPDAWTGYARAMAGAGKKEAAALRAHKWQAAAAAPLADLVAAEGAEAAAWSRAAGDTDPSALAGDVKKAQALHDTAPAGMARAALHLPTTPPTTLSI